MTTTCTSCLQEFDVVFAGGKQRERIGVVGGILEEIFGRVLPANGANSARTRKSAGDFACRPVDQRLYSCGLAYEAWRLRSSPILLLDAADPVDAVGIAGLRTTACSKTFDRGDPFIQLEVCLAELMVDLGILRPFVDQLH